MPIASHMKTKVCHAKTAETIGLLTIVSFSKPLILG